MSLRRPHLAALVGLVAFALFLVALPNAFVYDDHDLVQMNASIRDASHLGSFFVTDLFHGDSNYYRPLPGLLFTAVYRVAGPIPWAFRLVNLALHALASVLVFRLIRDLTRDGRAAPTKPLESAALVGALLFAVHPAHVEAVAWISGIMDVACAAFALLAFDLYRRADASARGRVLAACGLLAFLAAMLAKETAVVLPLLLAVYEGTLPRARRSRGRSIALRLAPWLATLGLYLALRAAALGKLVPHGHPGGSPLIVADLVARYVRTLFAPTSLSIGHAAAAPSGWLSPRGVAAVLVLAGGAAVAYVGWRRSRLLLFGLALFVLTLLPALALAGLGPALSKLYSDRYLYFPSVGWAVAMAAVFGSAASRGGLARRLAWGIAAAAGLAFAAATVLQARVWRSDLAVWSDAVEKFPDDGMNHYYLGQARLAAGDSPGAREAFDRAVAVDPQLVAFHVGQGRMLMGMRLPLKAILYFERAIALDPASFDARLGAADAFNAAEWTDLAAESYRAALALRPDSAAARNGYGYLLARQGRLDAAVEQFEAAVRAAPDDPVPLRNLASVVASQGDAARAAELRARAAALGARPPER